ncbi:osmoprotectant transporter permease [Runella sp. CRIBMP]|uniref:osmoprotectant transporter permease n=1 Tax=Runella sp. CRIBMP TaxID=2683261 RepID=UPI0014135CC2|nr:osmoprotectant transporter permease [Runella sp. CRIBMP]NBB18909.1 osmoprotectant transporter permease [Runella sp. CRIBMP]
MTLFWVLWGIDAVISLVVLYFFFIGLVDGSVSSFNMGLWVMILLGIGAIMLGSLWLKSNDYLRIAKIVLGILAVPGLLYALFMLMIIITKPRWN